jgi:hypothetical protein
MYTIIIIRNSVCHFFFIPFRIKDPSLNLKFSISRRVIIGIPKKLQNFLVVSLLIGNLLPLYLDIPSSHKILTWPNFVLAYEPKLCFLLSYVGLTKLMHVL